MSLSRFLSVLRGRLAVLMAVMGIAIAAAVAVLLLIPPRYSAEARVLVQSRAQQMPGMWNPLAEETDLVQSERVAIAALRLLGNEPSVATRREWQEATGGHGDFEAWSAEQLLKNLRVKPTRESNMLAISYLAPDPALAARVVNAFVRAYLDTVAGIRQEGAAQSAASSDRGTKALQSQLDAAEGRLSEYQHDNGIASNDDKLDMETLRLSELNTQLIAAQSAAATAAGRQREAGSSTLPEVLKDPIVGSLSAELARQEAHVQELSSRMGEGNPTLVEQRNMLASLQARMRAAMRQASSSVVAESRVAADRVASIQSALDAQRTKVLQLKSRRDQAQRLERDVDLARRTYNAAVIRTNENAFDAGAARGTVSVVKAATVPARPAWPRPGLTLAAALVFGLLAGIAAAFWREARDRRLRIEQDVPDLLGHNLIAVLSSAPSRPRLAYSGPSTHTP